MRFRPKSKIEIEALRFDGTFVGPCGVQAIDEWAKEHDVENCEVSCQGKQEPLALDITDAYGLTTVEAGDYVYITEGGSLRAVKQKEFEAAYEPCD